MGRKGERVFRNNYKGHVDKTKGGVLNQRRGVGMTGTGESGGGKMQTTVLEQQ